MELYIYPTKNNPTVQDLKDFRKIILDSLNNDANTWTPLKRSIDTGDGIFPLFTHLKEEYQNEPFYFRITTKSVSLEFEKNKNEGSKSMIMGMLTYYLRYNLSRHINKIEIS
jgi:hypothetical protein